MEDIQENVSTIKVESEESIIEDAYAYLERDFSSEKYKIEVKNMPKFYGLSEFKKLLKDKLQLNASKVKMPKRSSPYIFVCLTNEDEREKAMQKLNGFKWKGKELSAIKAKPSPDPLIRKRQQEDRETDGNKRLRTNESVEDLLKKSTIPNWNIPYEEQLKTKEEEIRKLFIKFGNQLSHENPALQDWVKEQKQKCNGILCDLLKIRYSNKQNAYRNKCEFTVGINEETGLPTVGFRLSSYAKGEVSVGPIDNLQHIPQQMKEAVKLFQDFVIESSTKLEVFNPKLHTGHFRQLTARVAENQMMLIVGIHPQNMTESELNDFMNNLKVYFFEGKGSNAGVTSLYCQYLKKKKSGENPDDNRPIHIHGDTHIYDTILGLKFRISPEAFFQINTDCAEILYKSAIELAEPTDKLTVVDICCGTGTIGLCFAKFCKKVLGLEIVPQAIVDAKENAQANSIENADFFAGKAEELLQSLFYRVDTEDVIAIVDPPRAGLHSKAIIQLRRISKLKRLIYISCNPHAALANFVQLGRPQSKNLYGDPFVPIKAIPVDMFPHTNHCELMILFERRGD